MAHTTQRQFVCSPHGPFHFSPVEPVPSMTKKLAVSIFVSRARKFFQKSSEQKEQQRQTRKSSVQSLRLIKLIEIARETQSLGNTDNPYSKELSLFHYYLKHHEYSEENLEFLLAIRAHTMLYMRYPHVHGCQDGSTIKENKRKSWIESHVVGRLVSSAKSITSTFIKVGSPKEVNLAAKTRDTVLQKMDQKAFDPAVFQDCKNEVFNLIHQDSWRRYLKWKERRTINA